MSTSTPKGSERYLQTLPRGISDKEQTLPRGISDKDIEEFRFENMADAMALAHEQARETAIVPDPDLYGYAQEIEEEYGVDLITPQWKAKPGDKLWQTRLRARARKAIVAKMFLQGFTLEDISKRVKVSHSMVQIDLAAIGRDWRRTYLDDIELLAGKDLARLDWMLTRLGPGIENGDVKSISAAIDIIKERGSILGYRAGVQIDIEQMVREVAEANGYDPDRAVIMASRISINMKGT